MRLSGLLFSAQVVILLVWINLSTRWKPMSIQTLQAKVQDRSIRVGIIGLGYVGLPLAVEFARKGIRVTGIDISEEKIKRLRAGDNYVLDVNNDELKSLVERKLIVPTTDYSVISHLDVLSICVPTPLNKTGDPDISFIISARDAILKYAHPDLLIILESTTYPGTTDELIVPALEEKGFESFVCQLVQIVDKNIPVFEISVDGSRTHTSFFCNRFETRFHRQQLPK